MNRIKTNMIFRKNGNVFGAIVVILFIITLIGMSGLLYWEKEKISQQYVLEMEKAEHEQKVLKEDLYKKNISLETTNQKLEDIEKQYKEIQKKYKSLEKDYAGALDIRTYISQQFEQFLTKNAQRWQNFEALTEKLDKQLGQLSTTSNQERKKKISKKGIDPEKGVIEIPAVIVKEAKKVSDPVITEKQPEVTIATPPSILQNAQVMSVNHEHNFVVLNKGLVDGIRVGSLYKITRAGVRIASIRISEIRDFVALGIIQDASKAGLIKAGDKIEKSG